MIAQFYEEKVQFFRHQEIQNVYIIVMVWCYIVIWSGTFRCNLKKNWIRDSV